MKFQEVYHGVLFDCELWNYGSPWVVDLVDAMVIHNISPYSSGLFPQSVIKGGKCHVRGMT